MPYLHGNMVDRDLANIVALLDQLRPALKQGDRARLVDITRQLVALRAPVGRQWEKLAQIAAANGELTLARAAIDLFVGSQGGGPNAQYQKVGLLTFIGAWREAHALLHALPADSPSPIAQAYSRGAAALYSGKAEEARHELERATQLDPRSGSAWYLLSLAVDFASEPALADRLIAAERGMGNAPPGEQAAYLHALGKLHDGRGEHALAFAAFTRAGAQMKAAQPYDVDGDRNRAADAVRGYSAERIAAIAGRQREPTARTIFVTGLPRSGTTLVQQILTSHGDVSDGAEIARMSLLAQDIGGLSWDALSTYVEAHGVAPAARLWDHWMDERFPGSRRVVDKSVDASRALGIAATLLPDAPLIWVTRDPLDCAWSCYRTCFLNLPWTSDLQDIALHFRLEAELLAQWQQILGERLLVVPYEALVASPQGWIRRILRHCGLSEESQVFAPHENRLTPATPSLMQVRRPINRDSIGAAEPYRPFLEPFIKAYFG